MEYLRADQDPPLIFSGESDGILMLHVDATFAVHQNMHGHTGGC
jgi:hypothetical protein